MEPFERITEIEHPIGAHGVLSLRALDGRVRVRAADGEIARVRVIYRVRAADDRAADRAVSEAQVRVDRAPDRLEVDARDRLAGPVRAVAWLLGEGHVRVDFEAEVPPGASVRVDTVSGGVETEGLNREQRCTTVSGAIDLRGAAGRSGARTVSGRVEIEGGAELAVEGHSVSGPVRVAAPRLAQIDIATMSGAVDVRGSLAPGADHRVETVSGALRLAARGGAAVEMRTISGGLRAARGQQVEAIPGGRLVVAGDGAARLRFRSLSGSLELVATETDRETAAAGQPPATPPESGPVVSPASSTAPDPQLAILQALERGEIGVDEAAAQLATAASSRGGRPPMPDDLETILRLVADGTLSPDQAAPIVETLQAAAGARPRPAPAASNEPRTMRIRITERGRPVLDVRVPVALGTLAGDIVPGLSDAYRSRIREAIRRGVVGSILEIHDDGGDVRIAVE